MITTDVTRIEHEDYLIEVFPKDENLHFLFVDTHGEDGTVVEFTLGISEAKLFQKVLRNKLRALVVRSDDAPEDED